MRDELIFGEWRSDPNDADSLRRFGRVTLTFSDSGELMYTVDRGAAKDIILMTYRVEGGWLVTNQPSAPREERTRFQLTKDGGLLLYNNDSAAPSRYVRADPGFE